MQTKPTISYRNLPSSAILDEIIHKRIDALEKFSSAIVGCHVVIEAPQKRRLNARGFEVRIHLEVPGPDLSVSRSVRQGDAQDDAKLAINSAFGALEKRLKEQKRKMNAQEVKHHPPILHGEIVELIGDQGYGYLRGDDGREVYFQRDSLVAGNWDRLGLGDRLRFREMDGEKGAFAVDVAVVD